MQSRSSNAPSIREPLHKSSDLADSEIAAECLMRRWGDGSAADVRIDGMGAQRQGDAARAVWSDVRRKQIPRVSLANEGKGELQREPNPRRTNSLRHGSFCSGRIVRQTRVEFRPSNPEGSRGFESAPLQQAVAAKRVISEGGCTRRCSTRGLSDEMKRVRLCRHRRHPPLPGSP
jgi:hypothetical protein